MPAARMIKNSGRRRAWGFPFCGAFLCALQVFFSILQIFYTFFTPDRPDFLFWVWSRARGFATLGIWNQAARIRQALWCGLSGAAPSAFFNDEEFLPLLGEYHVRRLCPLEEERP